MFTIFYYFKALFLLSCETYSRCFIVTDSQELLFAQMLKFSLSSDVLTRKIGNPDPDESSTKRELAGTRCTDVRLYIFRIKVGTITTSAHERSYCRTRLDMHYMESRCCYKYG